MFSMFVSYFFLHIVSFDLFIFSESRWSIILNCEHVSLTLLFVAHSNIARDRKWSTPVHPDQTTRTRRESSVISEYRSRPILFGRWFQVRQGRVITCSRLSLCDAVTMVDRIHRRTTACRNIWRYVATLLRSLIDLSLFRSNWHKHERRRPRKRASKNRRKRTKQTRKIWKK